MEAPNFFNWLRDRRRAATMDAAPFEESAHPRTAKGGKGGGQFAKKPETLAKEDHLDVRDPAAGIVARASVPSRATASASLSNPPPNNPHLREVSAEEYAATIAAAKKACISPHAWRVDAKPAREYEDCKSRLVSDHGSCIAVTGKGDIVSLCKTADEPIPAKYLMAAAVANEGDRLDTFEGNWELYRKCGFSPISWTPFNHKYKPDGWDESGDPEEAVIFFAYTGDKRKYLSHEEAAEDLANWKASTPPCEGDGGYDEAEKIRDDFIKNRDK